MSRQVGFAASALALALAGCDAKPKAAPAPSATATPDSAPTPPAKPTLPPTLVVDTSGALVAGTRVGLDGTGAAERLKNELTAHREFIEGKETRFSAERAVKPAYVASMVAAIGAVGGARALVRTSTRS